MSAPRLRIVEPDDSFEVLILRSRRVVVERFGDHVATAKLFGNEVDDLSASSTSSRYPVAPRTIEPWPEEMTTDFMVLFYSQTQTA